MIHGGRFHHELDDAWSINLTQIGHWTDVQPYDYLNYNGRRTWKEMCDEDVSSFCSQTSFCRKPLTDYLQLFSCPTLWIFSTLGVCFLVAVLSYCFCARTNFYGNNRRFRNGVIIPIHENDETVGNRTAPRRGVSVGRLEALTEIIHSEVCSRVLVEANAHPIGDNNVKQKEVDEKCSICMEEYQNGELKNILPCTHIFHKKCVVKWLSQNVACPLCRGVVEEDMDVVNQNGSNNLGNNNNLESMLNTLNGDVIAPIQMQPPPPPILFRPTGSRITAINENVNEVSGI